MIQKANKKTTAGNFSNKLISLLKSFSKTDLKRFEKYLYSSFFNENQDQIKLFNIVANYLLATGSNPEPLKKTAVWKKIYTKKPYNDVLFRRICSDHIQLALNFLAFREYKDQALLVELNMLQAINDPKLSKHYKGILRKVKNRQQDVTHRSASFHYNSFLIEHSHHKNLEFEGKKRKDFSSFIQSDYHLDCFYIIQKLKNYADLLGYKNIIQVEDVDIHLFPGFIEHIKNSKYLEEATIRAFYLVTEMFLDSEEEAIYHELKQLLANRAVEIADEDLRILYTHLRNYCILSKINMGRSDYFRELFELYVEQVESGIIIEKDYISTQNYKNIITVALHSKEFDWAEQFIQKYTDMLPIENQDNDRNYNLAKVYFHQHKYEKVIEQLREVEYKNVIYALGGKLMLLKTYFELKEFLALDSLVDSFRIYLRRSSKIPKEVKQQYMNVIRFTKKLSNARPGDEIALEKIKNQVVNCKAVAAKRWLLEKIGEME